MADRTTKVRLEAAVAGYVTSLKQAQAVTKQFGKDVSDVSRSHKAEMQTVGTAVTVMGAAAAAGFGVAVKSAKDFDTQMSAVESVANTTAAGMGRLRQAAIDAGAATAFSAGEAAQAIEELVKAGVSVEDVLGGALDGALALAAAGSLDLGAAAEIAAQSMNIFKLGGQDVAHIADVLAAGANKSAASVDSLGQGLRQGGLVAAQVGLSLEETAGALSLFADNALVGSDAGTSLKTMLQRLTPQSKEAAELMDALGFSAYDAGGNFIGLDALAQELQSSFEGMTTQQQNAAMAVMFGSDAVRAANVLHRAGAAGVRDYVDAVNDQGAAAEMAATKLDNLDGDLEELGGSIETALIQTGSAANGVLREMTQAATAAVNVYNAMPAGVQATTLGLTGIAGAAGLAAGGFLLMAPRIVETSAAMKTLAGTQVAGKMVTALTKVKSLLMGGWGLALMGGIAVIGAFGAAHARQVQRIDDLKGTLDDQTGAITKNTEAHVLNRLEQEGVLATAKEYGLNLATVADAALGDAAAQRRLAEEMDRLAEVNAENLNQNPQLISDFADIAGGVGRLSRELSTASENQRLVAEGAAEQEGRFIDLAHAIDSLAHDTIEGAMDPALAHLAIEHQNAADAAAEQGGELEGLTSETDEAATALENYLAALQAATDPVFALNKALGDVEDAQRSYDEAVKEHGANSQEAEDAAWAHAEALTALEGAALNGELSFGEFASRLRGWVDSGQLTAEQADTIAQRVATLTGQVEAYASDYRATLSVEDRASDIIGNVIRAIGRIPVLTETVIVARRISTPGRGTAQADGSVLDFYANGGTRENHVAQIAPAGAWRVWAEPETGGEAYIPLAASKRKRSVDIWRQTGQRLGMFADGGFAQPFDTSIVSSIVSGAIGGPSGAIAGAISDVEKLLTKWQEVMREEEARRRRAGLTGQVDEARRALAAADADARAAAERALADAIEAVAENDRDAAVAAAERVIAEHQAMLAAAERVAQNREEYEFGRMSIGDQIDDLERRIAAERAFTDEWMSLVQQRERLIEQEAAEHEKATDDRIRDLRDVVTEMKRTADTELQTLNRMLDEEQAIRSRMAAEEQAHRQRRTAEHARHTEQMAEAEEAFLRKRGELEAQYDDKVTAALERRRGELESWADIRLPGIFSVEGLKATLDKQMSQLDAWQSGLEQLRQRGLSEKAIDALGLAATPEMLGSVTSLVAATDDQLADLNDKVAARGEAISEQVAREQSDATSELAGHLADLRMQHTTEMERLTRDFHTGQQDLQAAHLAALADMDEAFRASQEQLRAELAAIGQDNGRSWAQALAEGIASGIPAIEEQVARVQQLLRDLKAAEAAAASAASTAPSSGRTTRRATNPVVDAANRAGLSVGTVMNDADYLKAKTLLGIKVGQVLDPEDKAKIDEALLRSYDDGGILSPGLTMAFNRSGRDEYVLTQSQLAAVAGGGSSEHTALLRRLVQAAEAGHVMVADGKTLAEVVTRRMATG